MEYVVSLYSQRSSFFSSDRSKREPIDSKNSFFFIFSQATKMILNAQLNHFPANKTIFFRNGFLKENSSNKREENLFSNGQGTKGI
jgi:hypothetical protein